MANEHETAPRDAESAFTRLEAHCLKLSDRPSRVEAGLWIEDLRRAVGDLAYFRASGVDVAPFRVETEYLTWDEDRRSAECARLKGEATDLLKRLRRTC